MEYGGDDRGVFRHPIRLPRTRAVRMEVLRPEIDCGSSSLGNRGVSTDRAFEVVPRLVGAENSSGPLNCGFARAAVMV